MLDAAVQFLAHKLHIRAEDVFKPSLENKEASILKGAYWYSRLLDHTNHEIGMSDKSGARVVDVWGLSLSDPNQKRSFYRYLRQFKNAAGDTGLKINGFIVSLSPFIGQACNQNFIFSRAGTMEELG